MQKNFIIKLLKLNFKIKLFYKFFLIFLIILKKFSNKIDKINVKKYFLYNKYIFKINILYEIILHSSEVKFTASYDNITQIFKKEKFAFYRNCRKYVIQVFFFRNFI